MPRKTKASKKDIVSRAALFAIGASIFIGLLLSIQSGDPHEYLSCKLSPQACTNGDGGALLIIFAAIVLSAFMMVYSITKDRGQKTIITTGLLIMPMFYILSWLNFAYNFGR